jgi:WD40 repeat protein
LIEKQLKDGESRFWLEGRKPLRFCCRGTGHPSRLRNMNLRTTILFAALFLVPTVSHSETHALKFVKKIGVGWQTDQWGWMSFVAFSPDGAMVASDGSIARTDGTFPGNLALWSFPEGRLIKRLSFERGGLATDLQGLSSNWKYYATSHGVGEIETGKKLISLAGNVSAIYAFSPDSRYLAESASGKGVHTLRIRIVELATGKQVSAFGRFGAFSLAISPDGETLAAGHWKVVTLWNLHTGKRITLLQGFDRYVESLAFSKDGKLLAAGNDFGGLQIWDVQHQTRLQSLAPAGWGGYVSQPAFSPDGRLVAVGIYGTGSVFLMDVRTGKTIDHQKVSDLGCGSVAFSPDGRFLITPSTGGIITYPYDRGGTIRVFQVGTPSETSASIAHGNKHAGAKARYLRGWFSARLKSCPVTKRFVETHSSTSSFGGVNKETLMGPGASSRAR